MPDVIWSEGKSPASDPKSLHCQVSAGRSSFGQPMEGQSRHPNPFAQQAAKNEFNFRPCNKQAYDDSYLDQSVVDDFQRRRIDPQAR